MSLLKKIVKYIKNPENIIVYLNYYKLGHIFPDKFFLKCLYKARMGKKLNLKNPQTFNEKLQWLKLYDRKPIYTTLVDKYEVKKYIAEKIGEEYIIPTLGVWDKFEDIDFESLPEQFVLKCTHDSGGLVICKDKSKIDVEAAKAKITKSLKRNYFWHGREWPYKNVKPRIIAEQFISDGEHDNLIVHKVFCFNGKPYMMQVIQNDKQENESIDYIDTDWNLLDLRQNFPNSNNPLPKPKNLDEMLELSTKLSSGKAFIRVDWYIVKGQLYFSEFTFYSDAGTAAFHPDEWDYKLGEMVKFPHKGEKSL